jgi:hypothetical protein
MQRSFRGLLCHARATFSFPMNPSPSPSHSFATVAMAIVLLAPFSFLNGCAMSPEDKAFFGRGWWNPSELDVDEPPPRAFTDPTSIPPGALNNDEY